jgi:hypothetical protein
MAATAMEAIKGCIIKAAAIGNQAKMVNFTNIHTEASTCIVKAARGMVIEAVAVILVSVVIYAGVIHVVDTDNPPHHGEDSRYIQQQLTV